MRKWSMAACMLLSACGGGSSYQTFDPDSAFFGADETIDHAAIFNDLDSLEARMTYRSAPVSIGTEVSTGILGAAVDSPSKVVEFADGGGSLAIQAVEEIELTLVAEIDPPVVDGDQLQATSIALDGGDKGMVSYNMQGVLRKGAIDWITQFSSDEPVISSQILFTDSDVNAVTTLGASVYAASATDDPGVPFPAVLERIALRNDRFTFTDNIRVPLTSFAATSVLRSSNVVYATSGSAGEFSAFEKNDLDSLGAYALHDARWVAWDKDGRRMVVVQGTPGQIAVFEEDEFTGGSMNLLGTYPFPGADIPESKSTVDVAGSQAFIAAGPAGVQIMCLDTGEIVGSVARPDPAALGLDPSVVVTNAVAVDKDLMFISNGEAGVYVATAEQEFKDTDCDVTPDITMLGQLQFDDLESVNHVEYENDYLFVAAGLGGVKIVQVQVN